jgi:hypothetical protein
MSKDALLFQSFEVTLEVSFAVLAASSLLTRAVPLILSDASMTRKRQENAKRIVKNGT